MKKIITNVINSKIFKTFLFSIAAVLLINFTVVNKATAQCIVQATNTNLNVANTTSPNSGQTINTGNDVNSDGLRVWVCDGGSPQIFWEEGSHTGSIALYQSDAIDPDVVLVKDGNGNTWALVV
jgi:hypothetical protein